MVNNIYPDTNEREYGQAFAVGEKCISVPQDQGHGKAYVPGGFAWHLEDDDTQLKKSREVVEFFDPRTRIAHLDTGYYRAHCTTPEFILQPLIGHAGPGCRDQCRTPAPAPHRILRKAG